MKMPNEEQKHFLALMDRPGDSIYIDISKLDISKGFESVDLGDIDSFTMHFSKDEILESIRRANIVSEKYLNGTLVIQDNQKHKPLPVIDKELCDGFQLDAYLKEKELDKMAINTIINKFRVICEDEVARDSFINYLKSGNIELAINVLFSLPYLSIRKLVLYLIEMRNKERMQEKVQERIRDKAA